MKTKPSNDINLLTKQFKEKINLFLKECNKQWLYPIIYEWFRTVTRQIELYNQWRLTPWKIITWTMKSMHLSGNAVDIVFKDKITWNITWNWPYDKIIKIAKQFWIDSLSPIETCHLQDNWKPLELNNINTMSDIQIPEPYTVLHDNLLWTTWFKSLFDNFDNDKNTKQLIDIAFARFIQRLNQWNKV